MAEKLWSGLYHSVILASRMTPSSPWQSRTANREEYNQPEPQREENVLPANKDQEAPPPYEDHKNFMAAVAGALTRDFEPEQDEVDRLQRFLIYSLREFYDITPLEPLNPKDTKHFLDLGQYLYDLNGRDSASEVASTVSDPFPHMIFQFRTCRNMNLEHCSEDSRIFHVPQLARKLVVDRQLMIKAIVPVTEISLRSKLLKAEREMESLYFTRLDGPEDYQLTKRGEEQKFLFATPNVKGSSMWDKLCWVKDAVSEYALHSANRRKELERHMKVLCDISNKYPNRRSKEAVLRW